MKYTLKVSYDCGSSYRTIMKSDNPQAFEEKCKKFDNEMLRWAIIDEENNVIDIGNIQKNILTGVLQARLEER